MVRSEITYNLDTSFHMLRHFSSLPEVLEKELLTKGYSSEQIKESLNAPGSRFDTSFANSVDKLLVRLLESSSFIEDIGLNGNMMIHAVVSSNLFPSGVGNCGVVSLESLDVVSKSKIYFRKNRGIELMHLDVEKLPRTCEYTVILKPANGHYIFITAFPGPPAMPLPDPKMNEDLLATCREYWDEHVFLVIQADKM
jgi:hypothetical protein